MRLKKKWVMVAIRENMVNFELAKRKSKLLVKLHKHSQFGFLMKKIRQPSEVV